MDLTQHTSTLSDSWQPQRQPLLLLSHGTMTQTICDGLQPYDWQCLIAHSGVAALELLDANPVSLALMYFGQHCEPLTVDILLIQQHHPNLLWVAVTDEKLETSCTWLLSAHFIDYFHLPVDFEQLSRTLRHAEGMAQIMPTSVPDVEIDNIQGSHPCIKKLKQDLNKLARTDETLLLSGETGTGKSLCAQWLHQLSSRACGPFINVNCGAMPATLIQSTLFGHEKGAFTGAEKRHIGHIEQAEGGTLFLDEIADLPLELQVNLLHFLDNKHILRIGSSQPVRVDCRVIFATHIDLETAVEEGKFREDLYHRINVLRLHVPSLREYRSDILPLAKHFLQHIPNGQRLRFSTDAQHALCTYSWPGNVRELQNRVHRAVIMTNGTVIHAEALGINKINQINKARNGENARETVLQHSRLDVDMLLNAVAANNNNISAAAKQLNISRTSIYRLIKKGTIHR